jgi:hypothetical protein
VQNESVITTIGHTLFLVTFPVYLVVIPAEGLPG